MRYKRKLERLLRSFLPSTWLTSSEIKMIIFMVILTMFLNTLFYESCYGRTLRCGRSSRSSSYGYRRSSSRFKSKPLSSKFKSSSGSSSSKYKSSSGNKSFKKRSVSYDSSYHSYGYTTPDGEFKFLDGGASLLEERGYEFSTQDKKWIHAPELFSEEKERFHIPELSSGEKKQLLKLILFMIFGTIILYGCYHFSKPIQRTEDNLLPDETRVKMGLRYLTMKG